MKWKADPPTAPMPKAPPTSSRMRSGQGSREFSGNSGVAIFLTIRSREREKGLRF
ncbi:hypothetical protein RHMOL_Rhmol05G0040100 [Rhododendron molle]|uniref:Uncharacterized protein n=1 Tax=Rhododendron molle TaxID=49168 RepID=A0ACC0NK62_RHOML|nr:hypothetical protein RHMOL_Rhmol05G0040100 [Rhododendron molle]